MFDSRARSAPRVQSMGSPTNTDRKGGSVNIDALLRFMVNQEASDLHLKPMRPPLVRIKGKFRLFDFLCDRVFSRQVQLQNRHA